MPVYTVVAGSTVRLRMRAKDNGDVFNLLGYAVSIRIQSGYDDGVYVEHACTIESASGGLAYYQLDTDDLDASAERWRIKFRAVSGGTDLKSEWIELKVVA